MRLTHKVVLLAMTPLIAAMSLIAVAQRHQEELLAKRQQALVKSAYMEAARSELRHFVAMALSTISPLYNTGRDDDEIKQQVMRQLAALDYGSDGYFFLYNDEGVNLMHARQPELVGRNLRRLRDAYGQFPIQLMMDKAKAGGGFVDYSWHKPSSDADAAKVAYVTPLPRWHWWFGTGLYVDDVDQVLAQLDEELAASVNTTTRWIAGISVAGLLLIFGVGLWLNMHELRLADAKLTLLTRQLVSSQESERAYLARELHDGTGQTLVSVKLLAESALQRLNAAELGDERALAARTALQRAVDRLRDALVEVRGMSHRLRPVMLDTLGLPAALAQMAQEMWGDSATRFTLRTDGAVEDLPEAIKTVLFRVTQEALANIEKHAAASRVELQLDFTPASLQLRVQDNGRGFDTEFFQRHPSRGLGLRHMRERLAAIDGTLSISSHPGQTLLLANVPKAVITRFSRQESHANRQP